MNGLMQNIYYNKNPSNIQEDIYRFYKIKEIISKYCTFNNKILDVGCGNGELLKYFSENNNCYGLDISEDSLTIARSRKITALKLNIECEKFYFKSSYFDIVVCSEVIEHILNTFNLLNEINRVLKKGGHLIISFPNINQPLSLFSQLCLDLPPRYSSRFASVHYRDFTIKIMKKILSIWGFKIIKINGTYIPPFKNSFLSRCANYFPRFSDKVIVTTIKIKNIHLKEKIIMDSREI